VTVPNSLRGVGCIGLSTKIGLPSETIRVLEAYSDEYI
jgi:hypothetical protein